jgi:hypothetical protein
MSKPAASQSAVNTRLRRHREWMVADGARLVGQRFWRMGCSPVRSSLATAG